MDLSHLITLAGIVSGSLGFLEYYFKLFRNLRKIRRLSQWESQLKEQQSQLENLRSSLENLEQIRKNNQDNLYHLINLHLKYFDIRLERIPPSEAGISKLKLILEIENWSILPIELHTIWLTIDIGSSPRITLLEDRFPPDPYSRRISIQSSATISREYVLNTDQLALLHSYPREWIPFRIFGYVGIHQLANPKNFELDLEMHKSRMPKPR